MANDQLVLLIDKVNVSPNRSYLKYNQAERGKIVDVTVVGNDGINPYDLSGKDIIFNETKKDNKTIIDGGGGLHSGKFIRTADNDKQGKFSYQFCDYAYQQSGECNFEFTTDSKHIDVSSDFYIDITSTGTLKPDNSSYVSDLESFKASYNALLQTTSNRTDAWLDQTKQTLDSQVTDKLNGLNAQMQDTIKKANEYGNAVNNLQTQWDNELKAITNKANGDTAAAVNAINQKYSDDFARLQANFTQWQTTTINSFNQKAQSIFNEVNSASDTTTQLQTQVTDAVNTMKTLMQKLDGYDFTKFVTGEQIKNYPTKDEVKAMMDNAGKVKTVDNIQPDTNGNVQTDHYTKSETTQKLATKLSFVKCDSPQAAYDASKKLADDGSIQIGIYDMNDGATSAVIGDKTVTIETLYNALNSLTTTTNSSLTDLQSQINSKTSGTIVTAYDIASKTPTKETNSYTNKWLVDQGVLGQFADQINQLKGRQTVDAPDFNTLTDPGAYLISNASKGTNYPPNANWGVLTVFTASGSGYTWTIQIYAEENGTDFFVRMYGWIGGTNAWGSWNQIAWKSDLTNLQNQIQAQQTAIETGYMKKPTVISKADYDKLATKDPNTLYEITE